MARWIGMLLGSLALIASSAGASAAAEPDVTVTMTAGSASEWRQVTTSVNWCPGESSARHLEIDLPTQITELPQTVRADAGIRGGIAGGRLSLDLVADAPPGSCVALDLTGTWAGPTATGDQPIDFTVGGQPLRSSVALAPPAHRSTRDVTIEPLPDACGEDCTTWLLSMPNGPQGPSQLVFTPGAGQRIACERLTTELARLAGDQVDRTEPWVLNRACSPGRADIRATTTWTGALFRARVPVVGADSATWRSGRLMWRAGRSTATADAAIAPNSAQARLVTRTGAPAETKQTWQARHSVDADLGGYAWLLAAMAMLVLAAALAMPRLLAGPPPEDPGTSHVEP